MSVDLRTRYLGLDLAHPIVASASPLTTTVTPGIGSPAESTTNPRIFVFSESAGAARSRANTMHPPHIRATPGCGVRCPITGTSRPLASDITSPPASN
jgi:hypothetical protein